MTVRFSIIVPTLNRKDMLLRALASVRAQAWTDVEIIVIDGGSKDGTIEALSDYSDVIVQSGPDQGVYDAINKGVALATGEVVGLLNSDDVYESNTFQAVAAAFAAHPDFDAVCGTAMLEEETDEEVSVVDVFDRDVDKALSPRTVLIGSCVPNARFFRRSAMARIGTFSLAYRYVADRDWLARWLEAGLRTVALPQIVYRYKQHTGSLTFDPGRRRNIAIRKELLTLARHWRNTEGVSSSLRWIATALEGRCRLRLAVASAGQRQFADAVQLLMYDDDRISVTPLFTILCGGTDWATQFFQPNGSRRRGSADDRAQLAAHRADNTP